MNLGINEELRIAVRYEPYLNDEIQFLPFVKKMNGEYGYSACTSIEFTDVPLGAAVADYHGFRLTKDRVQELMNDLWAKGFRPSDQFNQPADSKHIMDLQLTGERNYNIINKLLDNIVLSK